MSLQKMLFELPSVNLKKPKKGGFVEGRSHLLIRAESELFPILHRNGFFPEWRTGWSVNETRSPNTLENDVTIHNWYGNVDPHHSIGMHFRLHKKNGQGRYLLIQPRICNSSDPKGVGTYPRHNFPREIKQMPEHIRVKKMLEVLEYHQIYFLIMATNEHNVKNTLFWFGKYSDYPESDWSLNYRTTPKNKDQMIRGRNMKLDFISETKLVKQITNEFKTTT